MGSSYEFHSNGNVSDQGLQIIRHPLYQSGGRFSLHWFDARVFYVRISNFFVDDATPECLTLNYIPASMDSVLEVNGVRCSMESQGISSILRRDRVDKKSEEATFVSTDCIRFTGSVKFEVFDKEDLVISGVLEMSSSNGGVGDSANAARKWCMNCEPVISAGTGFLKGKQITGSESSSPTIEVYVAGTSSGTPVILTKSVQLNHRKKHRKGVLHSIPECDASASHEDLASEHDLQLADYNRYKPESDQEYDLYWRPADYIEGEDGELSWFNAGVRVGVGIGLGVCLGVGIGVGLLVRTYHTTARTFKRRLL
ncbi:uncharacterized protein At1g01500-like isoform X1 [Salvia splendens]|uniref:uncharacterized protein At1g01500-like isoform X1 n=1 Tax=Salvia splendens TaxID=180675 RepID=UPI0011036914|nr:uncharacterized protein At1g01500-like isoform X1 [Salvia splendens]XP_042046733.1 uncharacterized protein At1g01500-like isoform X1 [Salvia splendens]